MGSGVRVGVRGDLSGSVEGGSVRGAGYTGTGTVGCGARGGAMTYKDRSTKLALLVTALAAVLVLASTRPAWAQQPVPAPHAALLSSRFGCPACHGSGGDLFGLLEDGRPEVGLASDEACLACHTGGGSAPQVYGGSAASYRTRNGHGHNDPSKVSCIDCHGIHGDAAQAGAALGGKLLKRLDYQREAERTYDIRTASHDEALSVWCTGCHKDSWPRGRRSARGVGKADDYDAHPLKTGDGVIAFGDSTTCRSCHAAGAPGGIGAGDFPHYTPDAAGMLVGADSATGEVTGVLDADSDAVCLRCHRTGAGPDTIGVGTTY